MTNERNPDRITTETLKDEIYRVEHHYDNPEDYATYRFHKMGIDGHRIACDRHQCNCLSYRHSRMKNPVASCKHTQRAKELDTTRRMDYLSNMVLEAFGGAA